MKTREELTPDDFEKVSATNDCEGCYFDTPDTYLPTCVDDSLCDKVWEALNTCGIVGDSFIFKLKEE